MEAEYSHFTFRAKDLPQCSILLSAFGDSFCYGAPERPSNKA